MTPGCDKNTLLYEFRDNNTQAITAASMRLLVNCLYDNFLTLDTIVDNLVTQDPYKSLSANQGVVLNEKFEYNSAKIQDLDVNKANITDVYDKNYIDRNYYNTQQIDANFYTKNEVYTKQEVDDILLSFEQRLIALDDRITNIVQKNNLVE
jgi:hypothetical protein